MQVTRLACLVVTSSLFACGGGGGDDGGTTGPPPPPPPGNQQTLGSITASVTSMTLGAGSSQTIGVTILDVSGNPVANAPSPVFSSANATVAEVDNSGVVLGLYGGSTIVGVSVTVGTVTKTTSVAVNVTGVLSNAADVAASSGDYLFTPKTVAIQAGGSVTWSFGGLAHTVTFSAAPGAPASINESYGTTVNRTFTVPGNFSYQCSIHAGMSGRIVVR